MSIGNLKDQGNKGNNFPYQLKNLQLLGLIGDNVNALEPWLVQILAAIQNGTDYEAFLVVDNAGVTWLQVRVWNGTTFDPPVYYAVNSNTPGTPALPITYINPNTYLAQIVSNTTGLSTETTLASVDTKLTAAARTPNILRDGGIGTTPGGVYSFSIANVGTVDGTVDGQSIPPGVTINFDGGSLNNTLASLPYDATGTAFLITWIS